MKINTTAACILAAGLALPAMAQDRTPAPEGASVYIIAPADGATVSSPVTFLFGLAGMGVAPAGVGQDNTGHHHLLINVAPDAIDMDAPIPADDSHRHFGGGQTQATVDLPDGDAYVLAAAWRRIPRSA
jgi:hypothetical protein